MRIEQTKLEIDFSAHSTILVLIAHQDDEFGLVPFISRAVAAKVRVVVACLTSGYLDGRIDSVRDNEIKSSLRTLGIPAEDYWAIGTTERFSDSKLAMHLADALASLTAKLNEHQLRVTMLLTHDLEGGHQDHDACNVIARKLLRVIEPDCDQAFTFPMYHGEGTIFGMYKSFRPVLSRDIYSILKLTRSEKILTLSLPLRYPSQRIPLLGLFPFALYEFGLLGRLFVCRLDRNLQLVRPHSGPLLYERRKRFSFVEFEKLAIMFLDDSTHCRNP